MRIQSYEIPEELYYDSEHFWVRKHGKQVQVGISDYGQSTIGDVLYLEVGPEGMELQKGKAFGSIEAGKWVGRLQAPLTGTMVLVNKELEGCPAPLNSDPYGEGWLFEMTYNCPQELDMLLNARQYVEWVEKQIYLEDQEVMV